MLESKFTKDFNLPPESITQVAELIRALNVIDTDDIVALAIDIVYKQTMLIRNGHRIYAVMGDNFFNLKEVFPRDRIINKKGKTPNRKRRKRRKVYKVKSREESEE